MKDWIKYTIFLIAIFGLIFLAQENYQILKKQNDELEKQLQGLQTDVFEVRDKQNNLEKQLNEVKEIKPQAKATSVRVAMWQPRRFYMTCYRLQGKTALGTKAREGVVAVDPKVIKLGTNVSIEGKQYRAEDTGGMIKGTRLDLWQKSCASFHNRFVEIKI